MFLYGDLPVIVWISYTDKAATVSEAIALQLRRPDSDRPYLYAQLYAGTFDAVINRHENLTKVACNPGLSYIASGLFMLELRRIKVGLFARERRLQ